MQLSDAEKEFIKLVEVVYSRGISIDLERDDKVIARLTPAVPQSPLRVGDLNNFLRRLPSLGDDAEVFAEDIRVIRTDFPAEPTPCE
jgi:hypothetical protein